MENGGIRITEREISRDHVLRMVLEGRITLFEASERVGISYRHAKRLKKTIKEQGVRGLLHGNRNREPANKLGLELRERILELSRGRYSKFNDTHFTEMLTSEEGIALSRETVRVVRRKAGIKPKQKRRAKKHYGRRPRKAQEGLMMLWDGSPHRWFGQEEPPCCLLAAMDDATSKILALLFVEAECSWGYLKLLSEVVSGHGIPVSVYQDRHSSLKRTDDFWSIDEELAGRQDPTQVGAALESLGIEAIFALTPQAKGRVERLFRGLQDRLVAMLDFLGIKDIDTANNYVPRFIEHFNSVRAMVPEDSERAWRKVRPGLDLERVLSLKYEAVVANDNAVRLDGVVLDIPAGPGNRGYAGARVELSQMLDGSWRVYYKDQIIARSEPGVVVEPIRVKRRRKGSRASVDSSWVYRASQAVVNSGTSVRRVGPGRAIGATRIA